MSLVKDERIEKYLLNKMTESEKSAFQFELMQDNDLRQEVKSMRVLQKTLIANSRAIEGHEKSTQEIWKWLLPLLLIPILFFLWKAIGTEEAPIPVNPKTEIKTPPAAVEKEEIKREEVKEESPIEEEIKKYEPKNDKEKAPKKTDKKTQYIAMAEAADLVPNPLFEQMSSGLRGDDLDLILNTPSASAILSWQETAFILPFTGTITSDTEPNLQLLIFSNKKADYESWEYLKQENLKITKTDEGFTFSVRPTLQLKRGLYYYLIEDLDTEIPVTVGKFELK